MSEDKEEEMDTGGPILASSELTIEEFKSLLKDVKFQEGEPEEWFKTLKEKGRTLTKEGIAQFSTDDWKEIGLPIGVRNVLKKWASPAAQGSAGGPRDLPKTVENNVIQLAKDLLNLAIDEDVVTLPHLTQLPDRFEVESLKGKFIVRDCMKELWKLCSTHASGNPPNRLNIYLGGCSEFGKSYVCYYLACMAGKAGWHVLYLPQSDEWARSSEPLKYFFETISVTLLATPDQEVKKLVSLGLGGVEKQQKEAAVALLAYLMKSERQLIVICDRQNTLYRLCHESTQFPLSETWIHGSHIGFGKPIIHIIAGSGNNRYTERLFDKAINEYIVGPFTEEEFRKWCKGNQIKPDDIPYYAKLTCHIPGECRYLKDLKERYPQQAAERYQGRLSRYLSKLDRNDKLSFFNQLYYSFFGPKEAVIPPRFLDKSLMRKVGNSYVSVTPLARQILVKELFLNVRLLDEYSSIVSVLNAGTMPSGTLGDYFQKYFQLQLLQAKQFSLKLFYADGTTYKEVAVACKDMLLIHNASTVDSIRRTINTVVDPSQVLLTPTDEQNPVIDCVLGDLYFQITIAKDPWSGHTPVQFWQNGIADRWRKAIGQPGVASTRPADGTPAVFHYVLVSPHKMDTIKRVQQTWWKKSPHVLVVPQESLQAARLLAAPIADVFDKRQGI